MAISFCWGTGDDQPSRPFKPALFEICQMVEIGKLEFA